MPLPVKAKAAMVALSSTVSLDDVTFRYHLLFSVQQVLPSGPHLLGQSPNLDSLAGHIKSTRIAHVLSFMLKLESDWRSLSLLLSLI